MAAQSQDVKASNAEYEQVKADLKALRQDLELGRALKRSRRVGRNVGRPALIAALQDAYTAKRPIILWLYSPHWAPSKYEGSYVQFPPYTPECYSDPSVGINPDAAYDCGKPTGPIWKVAWKGVEEKWPGAAAAIKAFTVTNDDMGEMVAKVDLEGMSVEDVVAEWMASHKDSWSTWVQ